MFRQSRRWVLSYRPSMRLRELSCLPFFYLCNAGTARPANQFNHHCRNDHRHSHLRIHASQRLPYRLLCLLRVLPRWLLPNRPGLCLNILSDQRLNDPRLRINVNHRGTHGQRHYSTRDRVDRKLCAWLGNLCAESGRRMLSQRVRLWERELQRGTGSDGRRRGGQDGAEHGGQE